MDEQRGMKFAVGGVNSFYDRPPLDEPLSSSLGGFPTVRPAPPQFGADA
jgi:hypothetical protein